MSEMTNPPPSPLADLVERLKECARIVAEDADGDLFELSVAKNLSDAAAEIERMECGRKGLPTLEHLLRCLDEVETIDECIENELCECAACTLDRLQGMAHTILHPPAALARKEAE